MAKKRMFDALPTLEKILLEVGKKTGRQLVTLCNNRYLDNSNIYKVLLTSDWIIKLPKSGSSSSNEYNHLQNYTPSDLRKIYLRLSDKDKKRVDSYLAIVKGSEST